MKFVIIALLVAVAAAAPQTKPEPELKNYNSFNGELPEKWNFA